MQAPSKQIIAIGIDQIVTVTSDGTSTGRYALIATADASPSGMIAISSSATITLGPYGTVKYLHLEALTGAGLAFTVASGDRNKIESIGDMSGLRFIAGSGAPSGTTGQNVAGGASLYFDTQNSALYLNVGSAASPSWKAVSHA